MNLAHSKDKPGAPATTIKIDVRFVTFATLKLEIKEANESICSKPADPLGVAPDRGAGGKPRHLSLPCLESNAIR